MTIHLVTNQNAKVSTVRNLQKKKKKSPPKTTTICFPESRGSGEGKQEKERRKPMFELLLSVYICLNLPLPLGYRDHDTHCWSWKLSQSLSRHKRITEYVNVCDRGHETSRGVMWQSWLAVVSSSSGAFLETVMDSTSLKDTPVAPPGNVSMENSMLITQHLQQSVASLRSQHCVWAYSKSL